MSEMIIQRSSHLSEDSGGIWRVIGTMRGVNAELMPWIRMTVPRVYAEVCFEEMPRDTVAFKSWILLFGFIPIDRHTFLWVRVESAVSFVEESSSWLQRRWPR